jgi:hypothetical protein
MLMEAQRDSGILGQQIAASCRSFGQVTDGIGLLRRRQRTPARVAPGYGRVSIR